MYTDIRDLPDFNRLWLKSIGNVILLKGESQEVKITSDQDVVGKIKTEVRDGELIIGIKDSIPLWFAGLPRLDIYISLKEIKSIRLTGVGRIRSEQDIHEEEISISNSGVGGIYLFLEATRTHTELSGVGEIELSGKTDVHNIKISGTGKIDALNFEAREVDIKNSGVGECVIGVREKLHVKSSGIGRIRYKGDPQVYASQTGLGGIERIG
ncbi:MAG: head GIN domain-containing protein [Bacteroidota bacterium]|nr:head GIN domain-containing protein [Bacteroidota bacterium]